MPAAGGDQRVPRDRAPHAEKNRLKPWQTKRFCIPEADHARFVAHLEKVLDVYQEQYDDSHPLICMDEASKQVIRDVEPALPLAPGCPRREDFHYERLDVRAVFLFFDPLHGWRRVRRARAANATIGPARFRQLLEEDYPTAERVTLVCDNLKTHDIASLYNALPAATAHGLARRLRIVHTPRHGSWLNMAEIELSVLGGSA